MSEATAVKSSEGNRGGGRRLRRSLAVILLVAAGFVAVGVTSYVHRYQPIGAGSTRRNVVVYEFEGNSLRPEDLTSVQPAYSPAEVHIDYRPEGRFLYAFSVKNSGRWPITVSDVPPLPRLFALPERLRMGATNDLQGTPPLIDFRPFRLSPGEERYIEVTYRLNDCALPPEGQLVNTFGWTKHRVEYRLFGLSRHMELEIDPAILVRYNAKGFQPGCERTNGSR